MNELWIFNLNLISSGLCVHGGAVLHTNFMKFLTSLFYLFFPSFQPCLTLDFKVVLPICALNVAKLLNRHNNHPLERAFGLRGQRDISMGLWAAQKQKMNVCACLIRVLGKPAAVYNHPKLQSRCSVSLPSLSGSEKLWKDDLSAQPRHTGMWLCQRGSTWQVKTGDLRLVGDTSDTCYQTCLLPVDLFVAPSSFKGWKSFNQRQKTKAFLQRVDNRAPLWYWGCSWRGWSFYRLTHLYADMWDQGFHHLAVVTRQKLSSNNHLWKQQITTCICFRHLFT